MNNDTNGIARLAIRIFSIIANSGATECNFSDFGNIQTKKRSRLSVDKTHKINVVCSKPVENVSWAMTTTQRAQLKICPPTMKTKALGLSHTI
jgi:hypothetical protein